jgi:hypothetical protein
VEVFFQKLVTSDLEQWVARVLNNPCDEIHVFKRGVRLLFG